MALQDGPDARGGDGDTHGGELAVDPPVAPSLVLLREAEDQCGGSLGDGRPTRPAVGIGPALGDEIAMPAQQGCRLNKEVSESSAEEQSCESRQHRSICRLECRSVDLTSQDCHLVAQYHDLDREVRISSTDEVDQLQHAAERPVEEREGHGPGCSPSPAPAVKVLVTGHG